MHTNSVTSFEEPFSANRCVFEEDDFSFEEDIFRNFEFKGNPVRITKSGSLNCREVFDCKFALIYLFTSTASVSSVQKFTSTQQR